MPLHAAAYWYQDEGETVKLLLKNDADPNSASPDGTLLRFTVTRRKICDSVKYLVQSGAKVNELDDKKKTPLERAAINNPNSDVINYLVKNGATCNLKTRQLK